MKTFVKNKQYSHVTLNGDVIKSSQNIIKSGNYGCSVIIPHVCNNIDVFGGGFTGDIDKNYPTVKDNYHMLGKKNVLGYTQYVLVDEDKKFRHKLVFANMIAQNGIINPKTNPRPLNYEALINCMVGVRNYINNNGFDKVQIHAPKFGGKRAGGDWEFISDIIDDVWKNITVYIYNYNPHKNNRHNEAQ